MFLAFINRHAEFGDIPGEHDLAIHKIIPGETLELGAITVGLPDGSEVLDWFNQQEEEPEGQLILGTSHDFESGERLGFYETEAEAQALIEAYVAEINAMAADLLVGPTDEIDSDSDADLN